MKVFFGINARWQQYKYLPEALRVMYSAAGMWTGDKWGNRKRYPRQASETWLDFGGFTLLNKYPDYPFSPMAALNLVTWLKPDYFASLDYPCEPDISRSLARLMTNQERIEKTVTNAVEMAQGLDMLHPAKSVMVPVIQGYTLQEYEYCLGLYAQAGLLREYMAVGSVCRRWKVAELRQIIPAIWQAARDRGVERLHWFGLKVLPELQPYIYSMDTATILDDYSSELRGARGGRRFPRGQREKEQAFNFFLDRCLSLTDEVELLPDDLTEGLIDHDNLGCLELDRGVLLSLAEELISQGISEAVIEGLEILDRLDSGPIGRKG
jgi:hypothetical protein